MDCKTIENVFVNCCKIESNKFHVMLQKQPCSDLKNTLLFAMKNYLEKLSY